MESTILGLEPRAFASHFKEPESNATILLHGLRQCHAYLTFVAFHTGASHGAMTLTVARGSWHLICRVPTLAIMAFVSSLCRYYIRVNSVILLFKKYTILN